MEEKKKNTMVEKTALSGSFSMSDRHSPGQNRSIKKQLRFFEKKAGAYKDEKISLLEMIDLSSEIIDLENPAIYRMTYTTHRATGDEWCFYSMGMRDLTDSIGIKTEGYSGLPLMRRG